MAERLGLTLKELYGKLDSSEIAEWMAYDRANSEEFRKKHNLRPEDKEKAVEKKMSVASRVALYKKRTPGNIDKRTYSFDKDGNKIIQTDNEDW